MGEELKISAYAISVAGQEQNLDNVYVNGRYLTSVNTEERSVINKVAHADFQVYGVCDGQVTGGESSTEEVFPAAVAMQRLQRLQSIMTEESKIDKDRIWDFLVEANRKMKEYKAAVQAEEVQASFASLFLHGNRGLAVHLGDSRIYVIRGGRMLQITEDHLEATDLYKFGIISQKQAEVHKKNSHLTAYLGMEDIYDAEDSVFSKYFVFYPDDIFIICSDGITDYVNNEMLESTVRSMKNATADEVAQALIQAAGGLSDDDMSIVVLKVDDAPGNAAPVRGTSALPRKENFEKPAEAEEQPAQESDTTKLSAIMQGMKAVEKRPSDRVDSSDDYDDDEDEYDDDEYDDDEESIIDKILGNPKRLALILGGVLIVVVILILLFSGRGGSGDSSNSSSLSSSSNTSVNTESTDSTDVSDSSDASDSSVVTPQDSNASNLDSSDSSDSGDTSDSNASDSSDMNSDSSDTSDSSASDSSDSSNGPSSTQSYTVQAGDTLYGIIVSQYGSYSDALLSALESHNGINGADLSVGQTLELPTLAELGLE